MIAIRELAIRAAACICVLFASASTFAVPSGQFLVNINDSRTGFLSDSQQSITFWDAQAVGAGPLFSVHIPGEFFLNDIGELTDSFNKDEPEAITVDPVTGDVYVLIFDSGPPGSIESPGSNFADVEGDFDLYKINTQTVLNHWMSTFEGLNARSVAGVSGSMPNVPFNSSVTAASLMDYVTYGVGPRDEFGQFDVSAIGLEVGRQANTFVLAGAIEKIGQIKRNDDGNAGSGFFPFLLEFVDSDSLIMVDEASEFVAMGPGDAAKDHEYRIIERVSTMPNMLVAPDTDSNHGDGGFNQPIAGGSDPTDPTFPTESWRSERLRKVHLDFASPPGDYNNDEMVTHADYAEWKLQYGDMGDLSADGNGDMKVTAADYTIWRNNLGETGVSPFGHSEPVTTAYIADSVSGVRGLWVADSDGGGDDIAFLVLDDPLTAANNNEYREFQVGTGPDYPTAFSLDDDPFTSEETNDGKAVKLFVDADTGDLIIVESGFGDVDDPADPEMDGNPNDPKVGVIRREVVSYDNGIGQIQFGDWSEKIFLDPASEGDDDNFQERGQWSAYDSANDRVYFFDPDGGDPNELPDGVGADYNIFNLDIHVLDLNTGLTTSYLNVDDAVQLFTGDSFGDEVEFFSLILAEESLGHSVVPEPTAALAMAVICCFCAVRRRRDGNRNFTRF
jgi:hypothetical protein